MATITTTEWAAGQPEAVRGQAVRSLRLLFAANFPRGAHTGIGNHLESLAAALERRGHRVDFLLSEDLPTATRAGRLSRFVFPWQVTQETKQRIRRGQQYDAVNIHEPSGMFYAMARQWNSSLPPLVVTSHGVEQRAWELNPEGAPRSLKTRTLHPLTQLRQANYALRHADAVACLSSEDAQYLKYRLGVPAERVHRMANGVDAALLDLTWAAGEQPRLLFIGTWLPRKGTEELVRAFAALRARRPGLTLTILGAGVPEKTVLGSFRAEDRIAVRVVERVSREELPHYLARDQVFVLPSRFEGMPLSLLEAMAAGLPCVTTSICGMRDVIEDGRNGIVVPPRDVQALAERLGWLLDSPALRQGMGSAARETARQMTWDCVAADWEDMFLSVVKKEPAGHTAKRYDAWHEQVASRDDEEQDLDNPWHRFARSAAGDLKGLRVLEVACGRGQFSAWLRRQGAQTISVDFSLAALRLAKTRLDRVQGSGRLFCGDAQQLPFPAESFDLVVSCETLEHVPNPKRCLAELRRVLRPGGRLVLTTENYLNIWGLYRLYLGMRGREFNSGDLQQPVEQWMFSPQTARWIHDAGFRIEQTDGESHHLYLLPRKNPSETEVYFLSRNPFFRRLLRYFGRRFFVVGIANGRG